MTIFAGVYSRCPDVSVPEATRAEIRKSISRNDAHQVLEYDFDRFFAASVDIGALGHSGVSVEESSGICVVAGDPILRDGRYRLFADRSADARHLRENLVLGDLSVLARTSGTFAGLFFDVAGERLLLFSDKIGVRQVFFSETDNFVVFATALRIMEAISVVPKRLSLKGVIEEVELRWPTGRKTPYADIDVVGAAEVITVDETAHKSQSYWHWPENDATEMTLTDHLDECYSKFIAAIAARLGTDDEVVSFLSGGLDSRTIVAGLRQLGRKVDAINFAPPNTQDRVFAKTFSERIGSNFIQMPFTEDVFDRTRTDLAVGNFVRESIADGAIAPDRPKCVWGGNGGSLGLGHIYMTEGIVRKMRCGDYPGAIAAYRKNRDSELARRPLSTSVYERYRLWPVEALIQELEGTPGYPEDRKFYFFLMYNDQRRSMQPFFENIDRHELEIILPFFDSEFLAAISRVPVELCLYHRFYNKWLESFDNIVSTTPWQSYPGHEPSKVQVGEGLGYQFDEGFSKDWHESRRKVRLFRANEMLATDSFPHILLSKPVIRLARLFCSLGSQRLGYAIDKGYQYYRFASASSEFVFD